MSDMSEGEREEDGDQEMEAVIHGYDSDEMDEDEDADDMNTEGLDEDDGNREMTWHLEDIEDDSSMIRGESLMNEEDERDGQIPAAGVLDIPYDEEVIEC